MVKKQNFWTPDRVAREAKKYKTRSAFAKGSAGAFDAARRRLNIVDSVCAHMVTSKPTRKYSKKFVKEIVSEFSTLQGFRRGRPEVYKVALKYKWNDLLKPLDRSKKPPHYWTLDRVSKVAKKYRHRVDFMRSDGAAYSAAHRNGWLDNVCAHMEFKNKPNGYWNKTRILAEAKKYKYKSEFTKHAGGAAAAARRNGFYEKACAHMEKKGSQYERAVYAFEFEDGSAYIGITFDYDKRYIEHLSHGKRIGRKLKSTSHKYIRFNKWYSLEAIGRAEADRIEKYRQDGWKILNRAKAGGVGSRPRKWSYDEIKELASQYDTVKNFTDSHHSAYVIACRKGWWKEISKDLQRKIIHAKWTVDSLRLEASKYKTKSSFKKGNLNAYSAMVAHGYIEEVCGHMDELVKPVGYWTFSRVKKEAKKYSSIKDFREKAGGAYIKAWRQGWLDEICPHMEDNGHRPNYWTFDRVKEEASKYKTKKEFEKSAGGAFQAAHRNGWIENVCSHMKLYRKPNGYWSKKLLIEEAKKYKSLKDFRLNSHGAYDAAYEQDLMLEIRKILPGVKKPHGYWSFDRVSAEAIKYPRKVDFKKGAASAYSKALKEGWINKVCSHMT